MADKKKKKKKGSGLLFLFLVAAGGAFGYYQLDRHNTQVAKDQQLALAALTTKLSTSEEKPTPDVLGALRAEASAAMNAKLVGPSLVHKKEQIAAIEQVHKQGRYVLLLTYCVEGDVAKVKEYKDAAGMAPSPGALAALAQMLKDLEAEDDKDDRAELGEEFWEALKQRATGK